MRVVPVNDFWNLSEARFNWNPLQHIPKSIAESLQVVGAWDMDCSAFYYYFPICTSREAENGVGRVLFLHGWLSKGLADRHLRLKHRSVFSLSFLIPGWDEGRRYMLLETSREMFWNDRPIQLQRVLEVLRKDLPRSIKQYSHSCRQVTLLMANHMPIRLV